MRIGFAKSGITPRIGVELAGFGPFLLRRSVGIRDPLWARAMAVEQGGDRLVVVACDLIGVSPDVTAAVRERVGEASGIPAEAVMVHCTHTHSGPATRCLAGWGVADAPYMELLPDRIAAACIDAVANLEDATLAHAEVPCEGIGLNREYDKDAPPLDDVLRDDWRPAKPELTDRTCHVLKAQSAGRCIGFVSYFGCHPVVCCAECRYIHGDYCGVATNQLERELGAVGLFLQGAQGDVNSCVVHKPETEALQALDVIAGRFARSVRHGLAAAEPVEVTSIAAAAKQVAFRRKQWDRAKLAAMIAEQEAIIHGGDGETDIEVRMATVRALALRGLIAALDAGESLAPPIELHGLRIGPVALLGAPLEVFQAIKNDVVRRAASPIPLVMGLTGGNLGYAPDKTAATRGGYAADVVPMICGALPFASIHEEIVPALVELDAALQG